MIADQNNQYGGRIFGYVWSFILILHISQCNSIDINCPDEKILDITNREQYEIFKNCAINDNFVSLENLNIYLEELEVDFNIFCISPELKEITFTVTNLTIPDISIEECLNQKVNIIRLYSNEIKIDVNKNISRLWEFANWDLYGDNFKQLEDIQRLQFVTFNITDKRHAQNVLKRNRKLKLINICHNTTKEEKRIWKFIRSTRIKATVVLLSDCKIKTQIKAKKNKVDTIGNHTNNFENERIEEEGMGSHLDNTEDADNKKDIIGTADIKDNEEFMEKQEENIAKDVVDDKLDDQSKFLIIEIVVLSIFIVVFIFFVGTLIVLSIIPFSKNKSYQ